MKRFDHKGHVSFLPHSAVVPTAVEAGFGELPRVLAYREMADPRRAPVWSPALYAYGAERCPEAVVSLAYVALPVSAPQGVIRDVLEPALVGWAAFAYSDRSWLRHRARGRCVFTLVLPFDRPVSPREWPEAVVRVQRRLHVPLQEIAIDAVYPWPHGPLGSSARGAGLHAWRPGRVIAVDELLREPRPVAVATLGGRAFAPDGPRMVRRAFAPKLRKPRGWQVTAQRKALEKGQNEAELVNGQEGYEPSLLTAERGTSRACKRPK